MVSDATCWAVLKKYRETMLVADVPVDVLTPPVRALNLVLHAAHDGIANRKSLAALARGLDVLPENIWMDALPVAQALQADESFGAGLRLLPRGATIADRLKLPVSKGLDVRLHAISPPPLAMGFASLSRINGFSRKVAFIMRNLFPTPAYLRFLFPIAARGPLGMVAAYVCRWAVLGRYALPSYRAWRRIRREAIDGIRR
jgi:hypothetical protein